ncbi:MAG: dihydroneopterin aldolase [Chthoniobacterales bacterium]
MNREKSGDAIVIAELELTARIGVPDEERAKPQRLTVSLTLWPVAGFRDLDDRIARTVNYAEVCREVKALVARRTDKLLETLAEAVVLHLLESFPLARVRIELRKFVLPDVKHVAVVLEREK